MRKKKDSFSRVRKFKSIFQHNLGKKNVVYPLNKNEEHEKFQDAIASTLIIARALGFFPVQGLLKGRMSALHYKLFSFVGIMSICTIITLTWTAVLSIIHTVYKLIKATSGKSGGFANATAGGVFYLNNAVSAYLLHKIAKGWPEIISKWDKLETKINKLPKINIIVKGTAIIVLVLALTEHLLSIAINTENCRRNILYGNSTLQSCLKEYCLRSHSFIFESVNYNIPLGIFIFIISKIATFSWNFQDVFLMQICLALGALFNCLTKRTETIDPETTRVAEWKFLRELYTETADLTRNVGELVSSLVLLSFANNLYFICLQMLNGLAPSLQGTLFNIYFFGSFLFMVARLIFVTMIAASIPLKARRALSFLYCCPSNAYCTEVDRLIRQLVHDEIALTGRGFFTVNRNFILGIAGAIVTYEVVLLQFDFGQSEQANFQEN